VAAPYLAGVQADVRPASRGPGARRARPVGVGRETPGTPNPASHPEQGALRRRHAGPRPRRSGPGGSRTRVQAAGPAHGEPRTVAGGWTRGGQ